MKDNYGEVVFSGFIVFIIAMIIVMGYTVHKEIETKLVEQQILQNELTVTLHDSEYVVDGVELSEIDSKTIEDIYKYNVTIDHENKIVVLTSRTED